MAWTIASHSGVRSPGRTPLRLAWATTATMSCYHESADDVPDGVSIPNMVMERDCSAEVA